jgi:hypothetical protein
MMTVMKRKENEGVGRLNVALFEDSVSTTKAVSWNEVGR